jgi:hypothetical protein
MSASTVLMSECIGGLSARQATFFGAEKIPLSATIEHRSLRRVDSQLNAIKGGGACQLREKVLADMAKTWVMVADYRKNSSVLGTNVSYLQLCLKLTTVEAGYSHRGCAVRVRAGD